MNPFDAAVIAGAVLAIVLGFMSGLLRSLATILGYLIAAPAAVALTPRVTAFALGQSADSQNENLIVLFGVFIVTVWFIPMSFAAPFYILVFAILGSAILGTLGLIAGVWADKFDQLAAFQNFLIMPLTFLSGVFYSTHTLPPIWREVSRLNPFFYMIDGFRYGFFGMSDVSPLASLGIVGGFFVVLAGIAMRLLASGYKLRH